MQIRANIDAPEPMLSLSTENGGITLSANGDIELYVTDAQTAAITSSGSYDLKLKQPDAPGDAWRFVEGKATLSREVTH
jgi:hypothetical protein